MADVECQVAIVGGGPVGLGLAVELGQRHIRTVVVEKEASLHRIPKGQNLTQRTMEHFRSWGIEGEVRAARLMPAGYPAVGINAYGDLLSPYAHPWFRRSRVDPYYFARNERLPQYLTEQVLRERLSRLPTVTSRFGSTARWVRQDEAGCAVTTDEETIAAQYLVGCDGSHSLVREQAAIGEECFDHDRKMVLLVFRSPELHRILEERFGQASFFNVLHPDLDGYWRFLGRVDVGEGWFFHAPVPSDSATPTFDAAGLVRETVGVDVPIDVDYMGFWDLRIAIATSYQQGRLFIAGDAAHSHPPYGGYGINTGFEDARNLGWKLAATLEGWAGEALLASYTEERRPVFVSTARDFIEAFIERDRAFIARHDPIADAAGFALAWEQRGNASHGVSDYQPHYEGSPIVFGPPGSVSSAVGSHSHRARPGHHLPPGSRSATGDLLARLGSGFTLLADRTAAQRVDEFVAAAEVLEVPLTVVPDDLVDSGYGASLIVVRPDHFVSWVDDGSAFEAGTVLARSVGR